jgi:hypothetical protein
MHVQRYLSGYIPFLCFCMIFSQMGCASRTRLSLSRQNSLLIKNTCTPLSTRIDFDTWKYESKGEAYCATRVLPFSFLLFANQHHVWFRGLVLLPLLVLCQ